VQRCAMLPRFTDLPEHVALFAKRHSKRTK